MRLLLDTHTLLWWLSGSPRLGVHARAAIAEPTNLVCVSAASAWEIAIKVALGRLRLDEPPEVCIPREIKRSGFSSLPVTVPHALAVRSLPLLHRDPFDRLLIAQARIEQFSLVTHDPIVLKYDLATVDARR